MKQTLGSMRRIMKVLTRILIGVFVIYGLAIGTGAIVGFWIGQEQKAEPAAIHPVAEAPPPVVEAPAPAPVEEAPPPPPPEGWRKNAVLMPPYVYRDKKLITIIIDDMGMNTRKSQEMIEIKAPLVLSFLPYAPRVEKQANAARAAGHEILVHVPMEALDVDSYPGPHALMTDLTDDENRDNLQQNLAAFGSYIGVNNHMGSKFTADARRMALVMAEIKKRDLIFIDSVTSAQSVAAKVARDMGVLSAARDVFLDDEDDPAKIREQFQKLQKTARKEGSAIAIGHPRVNTLAALREWLVSIEGSDYMVVPLSVVLTEREKKNAKKD